MAKRVFFSFHYQDVIDFRANTVRKHWVTKPDRESAGFFDSSLWEEAKKKGDFAIKRLINSGVTNTSVTAVLIGSQTYQRRWVRYEIMKSIKKGNYLLGIHINGIKGKDGKTKVNGPNPLNYLGIQYGENGKKLTLYEYKNNRWIKYSDLDPYFLQHTPPISNRGKFFKLAELFPTYDWVKNDGYNNFSKWVNK